MAANKKKIDINKATSEDFETLVGIGHAKAEAIVEARQAQGGFDGVNALLEISGIGHVFLEHNKGRISCGKFTPARTPVTRRSDRDNKLKNQSMEKPMTTSLITPATNDQPQTSSGATDRASRTSTPCTSKTPCSRSRSALTTERLRRKLTRHASKSPRRILNPDHIDSSDDSESDSAPGEKMVQGSDLENASHEECSAAPSEHAGSVLSLSAPSSVESQTDSVMECAGHDAPSSPHHELMSDSPSSPALLEKPWMKRKSDEEETTETICGKKPRSLRVHSVKSGGGDSDYLEYDSAASLRSCLAAACNPGTIRKQRIPSKSNPPAQLAEWLKIYQEWSHAERLLALDELVELCEPTQVRHLMAVIEPQFQRDFISLLPKELALYVLSFLDPKDLLQAAQTCRYWRVLAEDNLLWREKCREESIDEVTVFENRVRRRSEANCTSAAKSPWKNLYLRQKAIEHNWGASPIRSPKVLKGHDDHVITCLEFSGTKVVSGSDDNTLKVWSAVTGKCLRTLVGHTGGVWSSQMCGNVIISGSTDRTLKVWNAESGQCTHTLYGHSSTVRCMHLNGAKVVSGSRDATLRLWNVETGQCLHMLMGHMAAVRCVQYDGKRVVSGAYDFTVRVWDPETESCVHVLSGHTNRVYSLQFDGVHIVSGSLDTSIRVWDVETGNCLHTLIGHQSLTSGMELKDNLLVSGNADSTVKVWDITTGQCLQTLQGPNKHQSAVTCLQFNKKFVITSSDDGSVKIWDLRAGEFLRNLVALDSGGSGGVVWRIRCSNTKLVCAVGSRNGTEETKLLVLDFDVEEGDNTKTNNNTTAVITAL